MSFFNVPKSVLFFAFVTVVNAYTTFQTTCAVPTPGVNFVSSPDLRGTLDILWSCLFTIFACTWTVQHPNIPEQRNGRDPGRMGDLKWKLKSFYISAKWMLITMVAPEVIVFTACQSLVDAKRDQRRLHAFALDDDVPWSLAHTYYANVGGFVIRSAMKRNRSPTNDQVVDHAEDANSPHVHGKPDSISGPHELETKAEQSNPNAATSSKEEIRGSKEVQYCNPFHLDAYDIQKLRSSGILPKLPLITEDDINDKSKSDAFVKGIALCQISWALLQIIVRAARGLAISQLELAVIAFAGCAVLIYALHWEKPKNICAPTTILQYDDVIPHAVIEKIDQGTDWDIGILRGFLQFTKHDPDKMMLGSYIQNDFSSKDPETNSIFAVLILLLGATLFGGIHVAAWHFAFPSFIETIFWRCTSMFCAAYGLLVILCGIIASCSDIASRYLLHLLSYMYIIARLFLIVEMFRTLCFLPPDAYVATWTANIPNLS